MSTFVILLFNGNTQRAMNWLVDDRRHVAWVCMLLGSAAAMTDSCVAVWID